MAYISTLQVGDIILVRDGRSLIARGITWWMKIYKREKGINLPATYHHAGTVIMDEGVLKIAEAEAKGYQIRPLNKAYNGKDWNNRIDVIRPDVPYNDQDKRWLSEKAKDYNQEITRYDFLNFIFQIVLIKTGRWIGPVGKRAENRLYCSEAAATIANYVRPGTFINPAATNPMDIATNRHYHFI